MTREWNKGIGYTWFSYSTITTRVNFWKLKEVVGNLGWQGHFETELLHSCKLLADYGHRLKVGVTIWQTDRAIILLMWLAKVYDNPKVKMIVRGKIRDCED